MWREERAERQRNRRYDRWMARLVSEPPDVLIGPDLPYGGVRGHIRAIARHSDFRVEVVPNEKALGGLDQFTPSLQERFSTYEPPTSSVVHSHVIPWYINWCREQQERGLRWIHTYHLHYFPDHSENGILRPDQVEINAALLQVARHADLRLSVAKWQCDWLRREHNIESEYLPNGVDVAACDLGRARRFRKKHGISGPFILWVGRNYPVKNPADFVSLAERRPDLRCLMLGPGFTNASPREMGGRECPPNLQLCGDASPLEVQDALSACSALVVTSRREGLPTLVLEAMSHGKPIVVPNEAGCFEAVNGGEFGRIYRQDDLDDLLAQTESALTGAVFLPDSRKRILEEYDWRVVAGKLDSFYKDLGNDRHRAR